MPPANRLSDAGARLARLGLACLAGTLAACGGGGGSTGPTDPGSSGGSPATVTVYYDQNGDGSPSGDGGRVPGVTVDVAGHTATTTAPGGTATVQGVPAGSHAVTVRGLPPFYVAGAATPLTTPQPAGQDHGVPLTLPIGRNRAAVYLGFGDSITEGDGSSDEQGYRRRLQDALNSWFGQGAVPADAVAGTKSGAGVERIDSSLRSERPAYTLILYGTNDWNDKKECRNNSPCPTVDNLRQMVRAAKAAQSLPVVATIIPVNVGYDLRVGPDRQQWVQDTDALIRVMADQEGAALADPFTAFMAASGGNLAGLFSDHIHPNDRGYDILAQAFFDAITKPGHASTAGMPMPLLLAPLR